MDAQPTWDDQFYSDPEPALWLFPTGGGGILVAVDPDRTVDELMADINGREGYEISNEGGGARRRRDRVAIDPDLARLTAVNSNA
jgi:hypothetical protein